MGGRVFFNWIFTSAGKLGEPAPFPAEGDKEAIKTEIEKLTTENKVVIFSKSISPHCHRAKKVKLASKLIRT
jgi:hypothetical protein